MHKSCVWLCKVGRHAEICINLNDARSEHANVRHIQEAAGMYINLRLTTTKYRIEKQKLRYVSLYKSIRYHTLKIMTCLRTTEL
jgi:hypothetical protein